MKPLKSRQRDTQTDKKQILHRTTKLHAVPINQEENGCFLRGCFDPNLSTIAPSLIFGRIPKCSDTAV